jgi:molybdate transport system substrate-binding protein
MGFRFACKQVQVWRVVTIQPRIDCIGRSWSAMGFCVLLLGLSLGSIPQVKANDTGPLIAAAANVKLVLDNIIADYQRDTGKNVRVSYGSSGNFVAQIQQGAPYELILSADEFYVNKLAELGLIQGKGRIYAIGRLALVAPHNSPLSLDAELHGLKQLLASGGLTHFAIANPKHAPYGERAIEVLTASGNWPQIKQKLILGENVSQALQFALSGSTQGGIVALSLVQHAEFKEHGRYIALPETWHQPLKQRMALIGHASIQAKEFYEYLLLPSTQQTFTEFGFTAAVTGDD